MKSFLFNIALMCMGSMALCSCTQDSPVTNPLQTEVEMAEHGTLALGADVSWVTQLEREGYTFTDSNGVATECMELLKEQCGVNAIRLRVWVNPTDGWNNIPDVLVKARRAHALGLRLMIDFHFSDTWADPGQQAIPSAWEDYDLAQACEAVATHVNEMLTLLASYDIEPEWVQIGNETRTGMMWPLGKYSNGANYAELNNAGYDAVKKVFPDATVIIHLDSGDNLGFYTRIFEYMKSNGGKYDMIGMSLYPDAASWQQTVDACVSNINSLYNTYGVDVMVCEIGMDYDQAASCRQCIAALLAQGQATGHLAGVFYWEPEAPAGYNGGYNKGCFDNGTPTEALKAFKAVAQ